MSFFTDYSIGNLTIDPVSANASKSNQNFECKDQKYFRRAPLMAQNELIDFQNDETEKWDEVSISNRARQIRSFALERWNPRKPGRIALQIAEDISSRMVSEQEVEKIFEGVEDI